MPLTETASTEKIIIQGGRVIDPANQVDDRLDVCIADGRVIAVGKTPDGFRPTKTIDATDCIVCPGLVDLCARLREPGQEHKATIASESIAAAAPESKPQPNRAAGLRW